MGKANYTYEKVLLDQTESELLFRIRFNQESNVYRGHFPDFAITPGVILIDVVLKSLQERFPGINLSEIRRIKFVAPILPETWVELQIAIDVNSLRGHFSYSIKSYCCAKGSFKFRGLAQ